jgi:hypothetical protein
MCLPTRLHVCPHRPRRAGGHISLARIVITSEKTTLTRLHLQLCNHLQLPSLANVPLSTSDQISHSVDQLLIHSSHRWTFSEKVALGTVFELRLTIRAGVIKRTKG